MRRAETGFAAAARRVLRAKLPPAALLAAAAVTVAAVQFAFRAGGGFGADPLHVEGDQYGFGGHHAVLQASGRARQWRASASSVMQCTSGWAPT